MSRETLGRLDDSLRSLKDLGQTISYPMQDEIKKSLYLLKLTVQEFGQSEVSAAEMDKIEKVISDHKKYIQTNFGTQWLWNQASDLGFYRKHNQMFYKRALTHVRKGQVIYDIGCGLGKSLADIAEKVGPEGKVVAMDSSAIAVREARKITEGLENVSVLEGDAVELLNDELEPADALLAIRVLEYLSDRDCARLLDGMTSAAKLGGKIFALVPSIEAYRMSKKDVDDENRVVIFENKDVKVKMRLFGKSDIEGLLESRGLKKYSVDSISLWDYLMHGRSRWVRYGASLSKYLGPLKTTVEYFVVVENS
jgi:ubiquinone/menaquinone biosynthesis C-methylase UbiE